MDASTTGQVTKSAADVYEEFFVPALFKEWAPRLADAAQVTTGQRVLDVACGTGVLTREVWRRMHHEGRVTGLDRNEGMLSVARRKAPDIDWQQGLAEMLPFVDGAFDAVVSQFGLMFFEDRIKALTEMWRVLRPGGRLAVAVWESLDKSPGYAAVTALLERLFGRRIADAMRAPFILGDRGELESLSAAAGLHSASVRTVVGRARFASIEDWVHTDIKGWTLANQLDDRQYAQLLQSAKSELKVFLTPAGHVEFDSPAHIVSAIKD